MIKPLTRTKSTYVPQNTALGIVPFYREELWIDWLLRQKFNLARGYIGIPYWYMRLFYPCIESSRDVPRTLKKCSRDVPRSNLKDSRDVPRSLKKASRDVPRSNLKDSRDVPRKRILGTSLEAWKRLLRTSLESILRILGTWLCFEKK